jgi:hypothetical protein
VTDVAGASWLPGVLVALIGIIPGVLVWRQAAQAREETAMAQRLTQGIEGRRVDQAAFEAARAIYEAGLQEAQRQLTQRLEQILLLERAMARCERRIDALVRELRQAGVPVPTEEP